MVKEFSLRVVFIDSGDLKAQLSGKEVEAVALLSDLFVEFHIFPVLLSGRCAMMVCDGCPAGTRLFLLKVYQKNGAGGQE